MSQRLFLWINGVLALAIVLSFLLFTLFLSRSSQNLRQPEIIPILAALPKNPFQLPSTAYTQIEGPFLHLEFKEPNLSLPDLKPFLTYYGMNRRPDASGKNLFFAAGDPKKIVSIKSGEKLYLKHNPEARSFEISPQNQPSSVWITAIPSGKDAAIQVHLTGVGGEIITEPKERARFQISEKPVPLQANIWMIGTHRADGTLLFKQKAKWHGRDLFLDLYGGADYQNIQGKQRLIFGDDENQYSLFAAPGDFFIWKDNRWQVPEKDEDTLSFPLIEIKKVDERVLSAELWDTEGKAKIPLNIIRSLDPLPSIDLSKSFQFQGARTKIHYMFQIDGRREIVGPGDWFIQLDGKWQKIKRSKDIDQILDREMIGPLLILDAAVQPDGKFLQGKLFNASHTEMTEVALPLTPQAKGEAISNEEKMRILNEAREELKSPQISEEGEALGS